MSPSQWPENWDQREEEILHSVYAREYDPITWCQVHSSIPGHDAIFYVAADAFSMEGVRVSVSATLAQKIADALQCTLSTSLLEDLSWDQCEIRLEPELQPEPPPPGHPEMTTVEANLLHSKAIDAALNGRTGFVRTVGKSWVLSNKLVGHPLGVDGACNYGWHTVKKPTKDGPYQQGKRILWQQLGTRHNRFHHDYSQTLCLLRGTCMIDGVFMPTATVMQVPSLAALLSQEGVLAFVRQPGVPYISNTLPSPPPAEEE